MALLQQLVRQQYEQNEEIDWRIESAGLYAIPGLPATPAAQRVALAAGLDLSRHRSRSIDQLQLVDYNLVLAMEQIQAEALASAYPMQRRLIYPFSAIVNLEIDIEDPTGGGENEHRACLQLLRRYLQAGMPRLRQMVL